MGAGGKRYIILNGDKVGQDNIELALVKPWEFDGEINENTGIAYHNVFLRILSNPDFDGESFLQ